MTPDVRSRATIERIVPDEIDAAGAIGAETLRFHLERYRWAAAHVRPGDRVLDIACGVGYGTELLAAAVASGGSATGVDIDAAAIAYARTRYAGASTAFHCADALAFGETAGYDVVVSLETIEHVPDPAALVNHLAGLLRPGGVMVASVPVTPSVDANPRHMTDFTLRSFRRLLASTGLIEMDHMTQRQKFNPFKVLAKADARLADSRPNLLGYYTRHPSKAGLRLWATMRHGFVNIYATIAALKPADSAESDDA